MTLKQFVNKIGGCTDKNMKVIINKGMNYIDDGSLANIRARLENKYYAAEYEEWHLSYFNIVDGVMMIQLSTKR